MKYIFGNWKMHSLAGEAVERAGHVAAHAAPRDTTVAVFPPFTALASVAPRLATSAVRLGAQDCSAEKQGAFTGDISALMLKDAGCRYVLVGHSERRLQHGESSALVRRKAVAAMEAGLVPVICVGETLEVREAGKHLEMIEAQVRESLPNLVHSDAYLIAYEPVWAIGTGKIPTMAQIEQAHKTIASLLTSGTSGARTPLLYGGSVKAANAREILAVDAVGGVLVGGASLNAEEFCGIIAAAGN